MRLSFRELEVFWAVMATGSIKEASQFLHVSQPAVSMMLRKAEERFGLKLFNRRTGVGVQPTSEARALSAAAHGVFMELQEFERQVVRVREKQVGVLNIAGNPTLLAALVQPTLRTLCAEHPDVQVIIRAMPTDEVVELVARRQVDVGITYGPTQGTEIATEDLGRVEMACVLRTDHPLAGLAMVTPQDLAGQAIASYRLDTPLGRELLRTFRYAGCKLAVTMQGTIPIAVEFASLGLAVALIEPSSLLENRPSLLTVKPFRPVTGALIQLLTPRGERRSRISEEFHMLVKRTASQRFGIASAGHGAKHIAHSPTE
jgi:DNA-binding transcriptional LysR family regulator